MKGRKLNRKELYSGSMVIFIAIFYLLSTGSSLFQPGANFKDPQEIKMLLLSIFYLLSGILFLNKRKAGWVLTCAILLHFVVVMLMFIVNLSQAGAMTAGTGLAVFLFFLLFLALAFLFGKAVRRNYAVNNKSYLVTVFFYLVLLFVNFRL